MDNFDIRILVVDDELEYREVMEMILGDQGYQITTASGAKTALEALDDDLFHIVLTDLKMGAVDGIDLLKEIKREHPEIEVIMVTGHGTIENAVDAMKIGAFNYVVKTQRSEKLLEVVAAAKESVLKKADLQKKKLTDFSYVTDTKSGKFKRVLDFAKRAAVSHSNILILGESGVGKEMLAHFIHKSSLRANKAFVPVNCSALAGNILESELFGHVKGAYTGAHENRTGLIESAHGGTLFLDEIGDISLETQVKLLRTLETRKIQKLGSNTLQDVDFRLICATNKNIPEAILAQSFREDFYYRINTIMLKIPPLRERREDLEMFINHFISASAKACNKSIEGIDRAVVTHLLEHNYDGNLRELKNIVERLVVFAEGAVIGKDLLTMVESSNFESGTLPKNINSQTDLLVSADSIQPLKDLRKEVEAEYITKSLKLCNNNISKAARKLGLSRRQLYNKIEEYNL